MTVAQLAGIACALVAFVVCVRRMGKDWCGFINGWAEVQKMDNDPDGYFQTHFLHPAIVLPLPLLPSQVFLVSPGLIKKYYACPSLDSSETKRELAISIFGMPTDALPVTSPRSLVIESIEKMYHAEMAPSRVSALCKRFQEAWSRQLRTQLHHKEGETGQVDINKQLYQMMVIAAIKTFFGEDFPASDCIGPLQQILSNLAGCVIAGSLRWPFRNIASWFLGVPARRGARELAAICERWLNSHGTAGSCELVVQTEELAKQAGWSRKETVVMMAMLLFTLVGERPITGRTPYLTPAQPIPPMPLDGFLQPSYNVRVFSKPYKWK
jgi:hypothetical protein